MSFISNIPYTSLLYALEAQAAFHPYCEKSSLYRITGHIPFPFGDDTPLKKKLFLRRIIHRYMQKYSLGCYATMFEFMGMPVFTVRNLGFTLQDPKDRVVCIVHLDEICRHYYEANHGDTLDCFCVLGFLSAIVAVSFMTLFQTPTPLQQVSPHPFLSLYN